MSKRSIWIAEALVGVIGIIALFLNYEQITVSCVVAIAATLDKLTEK